jgi:hypothetical protein
MNTRIPATRVATDITLHLNMEREPEHGEYGHCLEITGTPSGGLRFRELDPVSRTTVREVEIPLVMIFHIWPVLYDVLNTVKQKRSRKRRTPHDR